MPPDLALRGWSARSVFRVLLYEEMQQEKEPWWRLDFWMSQLLAWCYNLFKGEDGNPVRASELVPRAEPRPVQPQSVDEMLGIARQLVGQFDIDD